MYAGSESEADRSDIPESSLVRFLADASHSLAASLDYEATLVSVAAKALPYTGSWCTVDILEHDGSVRRLAVVHPDEALQYIARRLKSGWPPRPDDGTPVPRVIRTLRTEVIPRVTDQLLVSIARNAQHLMDLRALGIGSVLAVSLIARGKPLGAMTFISADTGHQYTEGDVALAEDLAARCALAIDNSQLYHKAEASAWLAAQMNEKLIIASLREQELAEEANSASRAKSHFLSTMSHEIRTPLNAISGYADLMGMEVSGPMNELQHNYIDRIRLSSKHLLRIVEDILDVAKLQAGRLVVRSEPMSLGRAAVDAIALTSHEAKTRQITVQIRTENPLMCLADHDRVRQIIINLLTNAIKFSFAGGIVIVTCDASPTIESQAAAAAGPWLLVRVQDSGIGIAAVNHSSIFEPFVQVEGSSTRTHGGSGLGLSISRELARRMGGDLTVQSELGGGAIFTLWLPQGPAQN